MEEEGKKMDIVPITDQNSRQLAFTERRDDLFEELSQLSSLYPNTQFAVITFDPAGNLFAYANPSVETVLDRFRSDNCSGEVVDTIIDRFRSDNRVDNCGVGECPWWERSADGMSLEELEEFKSALEGLKAEVEARVSSLSRSSVAVDVKEDESGEWMEDDEGEVAVN